MLNEEQLLKDAITYMTDGLAEDNILVLPKNQKSDPSFFRVPRIPCVVVTVSSQPSVNGLGGEYLANAQIHVTVYAHNVYAPENSVDGIHTIFDKLNVLMNARYYSRSNQTEPYYNVSNKAWNKDGYFVKKTNKF